MDNHDLYRPSTAETQPNVHFCTVESEDNCEAFFASTRESVAFRALSAEVAEQFYYNKDFFYSLLIDTGCARASSGGYEQYQAYFRHTGQPPNICKNIIFNCRFGISATASLGVATVTFPMQHLTFQVKIHIVDDYFPLHYLLQIWIALEYTTITSTIS